MLLLENHILELSGTMCALDFAEMFKFIKCGAISVARETKLKEQLIILSETGRLRAARGRYRESHPKCKTWLQVAIADR